MIVVQLCCLFLVQQAQAQFEVGTYASVNMELCDEICERRIEPRGFSAGLMSHYNLKPKLDVAVGLLYNRTYVGKALMGWCATPPLDFVDIKTENIELQTRLRYHFLNLDNISAFTSVGLAQFAATRYFFNGMRIDQNQQAVRYRLAGLLNLGGKIRLNQAISLEMTYDIKYFFRDGIRYEKPYIRGFSFSLLKKIRH